MQKTVVFIILIFTLTSCKKQKMIGDNSRFVGTWKWYTGWWAITPNYKIVITDNGKFKLFDGDNKIDYGRLLNKDGYLTFISDKPFNKGYFSNERYQLSFHNTDTIGIGNAIISDFPNAGYRRE